MCYTCIEYSLSLLGIDKITNKRRKEKMKKVFIGIIAIIMVLGLVGCGKSNEVKTVEELISAIGTVSIESGEAIHSASDAYSALNEKQQKEVENIATLQDAEKSFVELAKKESNEIMLDKKPNDAIAILQAALPFDSSIQENIDIIYGWCFDINGELFIKPSLLYTGVKLVGLNPHDAEHELDSYFYSPMSGADFADYVKYMGTEFTLNNDETLESPSFIRYQFLDDSGSVAFELSSFEYNNDLAMSIAISPEMNNTQYSDK